MEEQDKEGAREHPARTILRQRQLAKQQALSQQGKALADFVKDSWTQDVLGAFARSERLVADGSRLFKNLFLRGIYFILEDVSRKPNANCVGYTNGKVIPFASLYHRRGLLAGLTLPDKYVLAYYTSWCSQILHHGFLEENMADISALNPKESVVDRMFLDSTMFARDILGMNPLMREV